MLPIMHTFDNVICSAKSLALTGLINDENNQNLSYMRKWLLRAHQIIGHLSFQHLQWIGRQGWLGAIGLKIGKATVIPPKCVTCHFSKQERLPRPGKTIKVDKESEGILSADTLNPGDLVFSDQYESSLEVRVFTYRGYDLSTYKYKGGKLYCDASSSYIFISHQVTLSSQETISSTLNFEREALGVGIQIKQYQTVNGIYTFNEFQK